jgi:beta-glucosidase
MSPEEPVSPGRKLLLAAGGACLLLALSISAPVARGQPAPTTHIDSLLAEMTVEEKLGQLAQYTGQWATTGPEASADQEALIRDGAVGSFLNIYGAEETCRLQRMAVEESRLGIPLLFAYDVVHGFRTVFPMPLAMASSWNPSMARRAARVGATEASAAGVHWTFAPMLDVTREPRWGRIMESFGEDPYLSSVMARAGVEGFQGDDLSDPRTLLSTAKHYVAYGAPQAGRDYNTVDLSRRTLREVFLPPFRAAADAGAASIMAAFNEVNGIPMHAHDRLINGVLRDEWGWNGLLVSDYTGVRELIQHGIAASKAEAGMKALRAGVDVDMVSGIYGDVLPEVARDGRLDEETVDRAVRRVLRAKHRAGLFEDPYRYCKPDREDANTLTDEHRRSARRVARESIVLLKNEGDLLPLSKDAGTIAVIGSLAVDRRSVLGEWAGAGRAEDAVTILESIRRRAGLDAEVRYAKGAGVTSTSKAGFDEAAALAREAEVAVLVLGESYDMSGEAASRTSIDLPGVQRALAKKVYQTSTPTVAVLTNGRPLAVSWLDDNVPAILETWHLGTEMGNAVADVLFGDYNPAGSLPVTFPRNVGQVPIYYNHKNTGRPPAEKDYTSRYLNTPWTPLYPFGHGLSYTTFAYDDLRVSTERVEASGEVGVSVDVTNTGERAGDEIVQFYVRDSVASVTRPVKELRGFRRIHLEPGEVETVTITLGPEDLAFYNRNGEYVVEPGYFKVFAGGSSRDVVEASFRVVGEPHRAGMARGGKAE